MTPNPAGPAGGGLRRRLAAQTGSYTDSMMTKPASSPRSSRPWASLLVLSAVLLLQACGERKDGAANAVAARVDKADITAAQVSAVLQQQRALRPEQTDAVSKQILERLIEQQLVVQKAEATKLDRDPRVQQLVEAARREVLARVYLEKVGEAAPKPSPEDIAKYYADKPELFRDRRIFNLQELNIESRPEQFAELRDKLGAAKDLNEFVEYIKAQGLRYNANQAVRAAEQLPLASLEAISRMKDGQAMITAAPTGAVVVFMAGSRAQPVAQDQARPAIEQFLLSERRRKLAEDDIKALRTAAKIEYLGSFGPATAASAAGTTPK